MQTRTAWPWPRRSYFVFLIICLICHSGRDLPLPHKLVILSAAKAQQPICNSCCLSFPSAEYASLLSQPPRRALLPARWRILPILLFDHISLILGLTQRHRFTQILSARLRHGKGCIDIGLRIGRERMIRSCHKRSPSRWDAATENQAVSPCIAFCLRFAVLSFPSYICPFHRRRPRDGQSRIHTGFSTSVNQFSRASVLSLPAPTLHHHPLDLPNLPRFSCHQPDSKASRMSRRQHRRHTHLCLAKLQHHPHHPIVCRRTRRKILHRDMPQKSLQRRQFLRPPSRSLHAIPQLSQRHRRDTNLTHRRLSQPRQQPGIRPPQNRRATLPVQHHLRDRPHHRVPHAGPRRNSLEATASPSSKADQSRGRAEKITSSPRRVTKTSSWPNENSRGIRTASFLPLRKIRAVCRFSRIPASKRKKAYASAYAVPIIKTQIAQIPGKRKLLCAKAFQQISLEPIRNGQRPKLFHAEQSLRQPRQEPPAAAGRATGAAAQRAPRPPRTSATPAPTMARRIPPAFPPPPA